MFRYILAFTLFFTTVSSVLASPSTPRFRRYPNAVPDRYVVVLEPAVGIQFREVAKSLGMKFSGRVTAVFERVVGGFAMEMTEAQAFLLSQDPRVAYVAENVQTTVAQSLEPSVAQSGFNLSWGLDRIDQEGPVSGGDGVYSMSYFGDNVLV